MEVDVLTGQTVKSVDFGYGVLLFGPGGDMLQIETPFDRVLAGGDRVHFGAEALPSNDAILSVQSLTVELAEFTDDKRLVLSFDDRSTLQVPAHPEFESWHVTRQDGSSLLCTPGGGLMEPPPDDELPSFGEALIEWAQMSIVRLEAEDIEIVGLDIRGLTRRPDHETPLGRQAFRAFLEMVEGVDAFTADYTAVLWLPIGGQGSEEPGVGPPAFEEFLESRSDEHGVPRFSVVVPTFWARYEERERQSTPVGDRFGTRVPVRVHHEATRAVGDSGQSLEWRRAFSVRSYLSRDEAASDDA